MENSAAVGFENVKVFAADPWYEAQPGSIKNLKISVKVGNATEIEDCVSAECPGFTSFNYPITWKKAFSFLKP